ncbi:MAG: cytochrome c oxidase subunit I, partial [Mesorhizobium sp.]
MVDITPADAVPPAEVAEVELYHPHSWWTKYVFSQDAKVIAIQYSATATAIGLVALVLSWLMRLQLGFPGTFDFITPEAYYQFITMHGMIMVIYLLTALFLGGFGNYLIPLMVGARDMVFPYVNMLSYWIYLLAVLVLVSSFFAPGGPTGAGWTLYPPQAIMTGTPGGQDWGIMLMLVSLILFIIGFTMGGLNYVVTVLQGRTRGMTLMRLPLTVWGIFTATVMALLAFPALFVACVMMLFDRALGTSFFMPAIVEMGEQLQHNGGSPILFQHLFWFFGHPEVYIVALPAFGIVSDLISTHARKNIFGYRMMVWAIVAIGALSFLVWAHHMYVSGMHPYFGFFFATTTLIIAVPTAIKVYNWVLTLWRGDIHLTIPMLFALAFIVTFVNGGLTGLFLGNVVVDVPLSDTMFVVAHFHMVMGVAPIIVIFGAIYHWYPKVTGRMLNETLGRFHFWVTFLGAYLIFFPMHYLGLMGVPRRYNELTDMAIMTESAHHLNSFISIMAFIVGFAQMVFLFNLIWSIRHGREAGGNPWRATTLEWQTPETPPAHGNFGKELPIVYRWAYDYSVPG